MLRTVVLSLFAVVPPLSASITNAWADSDAMGMSHSPMHMHAAADGTDMKSMHATGPAEAAGAMKGMSMPMGDEPANFKVAKEVFTSNREFLVKLVDVPEPIPYQKHFTARFAVYDGKQSEHKVSDASVQVSAGMRHGMQSGFAHGMQYSPKIETKDGVVSVSGLSFHMTGKWTLQIDVRQGSRKGTAYFDLPCCAE